MGSLLALFFAVQHREWVEKVILIGCPPFEDKYVPLIIQRRMERLAVQEQTDFLQLLSHTHLSDDEFIRLQGLVARTDNYHVKVNENDFAPDQSAYEQVWNEKESCFHLSVYSFEYISCHIFSFFNSILIK